MIILNIVESEHDDISIIIVKIYLVNFTTKKTLNNLMNFDSTSNHHRNFMFTK